MKKRPRPNEEQAPPESDPEESPEDSNGAIGPDGTFVEFPEYDGSEQPKEPKKAFTHFCINTRKEVKQSLNPSERKDKEKVHGILKARWLEVSDEEKHTWRAWGVWDKKRYERDLAIFEAAQSNGANGYADADDGKKRHILKKSHSAGDKATEHVPKKKKKWS